MLSGKKTFGLVVITIIGAWSSYFTGAITLEAAIGATLAALTAAAIRDGVTTEAAKAAAAVPDTPEVVAAKETLRRAGVIIAPLFLLALVLSTTVTCTTATPVVTQPANVNPVATTGQGGTDASAAQFFGFAVTRPTETGTPLSQWTFPNQGGTSTRPIFTLHRRLDPATGKVLEEYYDTQLGPDGKPIMETVSAGLFIDARNSTFTNSVTPQGAVTGSGTTQSGTAAPASTQTTTQTTNVPVTANVPVTLPNGTTIPAGGVIPAGTPVSVIPAGAVVKPVQ